LGHKRTLGASVIFAVGFLFISREGMMGLQDIYPIAGIIGVWALTASLNIISL